MLKSAKLTLMFNDKKYEVEIDKLLVVLCALESKKINFESEEQIKALVEKYKLYDEYFLENINKLVIKN